MQHPSASSRQTYLDWLRIISILSVLVFHSAMPYVSEWGWHIKNKETSNMLLEFNDFTHRFRMPLLFFISGTVSYYMLQHRTGGGFIGLRFRRLFVPLLLGMLVIVPPQVYLERVTQGFKGNFLDFYTTMFTTGAYPAGNLSWHHLWFVCYLLVFDIVLAPLFVWLLAPKGKAFLQRLNGMTKGKWIYLMIIPGVLVYALLAMNFPATGDLVHDYAHVPYYLFFLLAGFICIACPGLMDSIETNRRTSFTIAFASILVINCIRWNGLEPWDALPLFHHHPFSYLYMALSGVSAWMWVLTLVGYGKKYLNKKSKILDYANQAVYPFYILHQTVIVILTYYVVTTPDGVGLKFSFTVVTTFILCLSFYHLFIRPFAPMRFLFGMKPLPRKTVAALEKEEVMTPDAVLS